MTTVDTELPCPSLNPSVNAIPADCRPGLLLALHPDSPGTTTTVFSQSLTRPERCPILSMCLDVSRSSSAFPSPSSSLVLPPGNHDFAIPPPSGCSMPKGSIVTDMNESPSGMANGNENMSGKDRETSVALEPHGIEVPSSPSSIVFESQVTPIPLAILPSQRPTPTLQQLVADANTPTTLSTAPVSASPTPSPIKIPSPLPSPPPVINPITNNPLTPNRPAPPSPAASRRVSSVSTFSNRSPAPSTSTTVSRANSVQRSSRLSANTSAYTSAAASAAVIVHVQNSKPRVLIRIRDFAFDKADERFCGAGALVPRANHLAVLHRKLAGLPEDEDEETSGSEADGEDFDVAWDKLRVGWSVNGWGKSSAIENGPSKEEMDLNFGGATEADYEDYEDDGLEAHEELLYPGVYRAVYAFEPEGTAEMALIENQVVRVVGRGGGVGWAVVIDESAGLNENGEPRHALVPESYLEAVRLDWEEEEAT